MESKVIVINHGSHSLKIGLASDNAPKIIPNWIARRIKKHDNNNNNNNDNDTIMKDNKDNKDDHTTTTTIDETLKSIKLKSIQSIRDYLKDNQSNHQHHIDPKYSRKQININETNHIVYEPLPKKKKKKKKITNTNGNGNGNGDMNGDQSNQSILTNGIILIDDDMDDIDYEKSKYCVGDDAIQVSKDTLHWHCYQPLLSSASFNITNDHSLRSLCDDLVEMWKYCIHRYLNILPQDLNSYGCVYILPDQFGKRELKEITSLLLKDLPFTSLLLYQQSVCSLFGASIGTGCVVDIGHRQISIACVDEGYLIPQTRITLQYGGDNLTRLLYWLLYQHDSKTTPIHTHKFPIPQSNINQPFYNSLIDQIKINNLNLFINDDDKVMTLPIKVKEDDKLKVYQFNGDKVYKFTALSLFYPKLLSITLQSTQSTQSNNNNNKDSNSTKKSSSSSSSTSTLISELIDNEELYDDDRKSVWTGANSGSGLDPLMPLDKAIYRSIHASGERSDTRRKYYANILLVGGGAKIQGLDEFLKYNLQLIYQHYNPQKDKEKEKEKEKEQININNNGDNQSTTNTTPSTTTTSTNEPSISFPNNQRHEVEPNVMSWKGGAILGCLESSKEIWITRNEWKQGQYSSSILKEKIIF